MTDTPSSNDDAVAAKPRRLSGIILIVMVAIIFGIVYYRPEVTTVYCDEASLTPKPDVIMLGAWWCSYCYQARRYFERNEIRYCEYDVERSDEGRKIYEDINGMGVPIILIGDQRLNGYDENTLDRMLSELHSS